MESDTAATEVDIANINSMTKEAMSGSAFEGGGASADAAGGVKQEGAELSEMQKLQKQIEALKADPKAYFTKYQDFKIECDNILNNNKGATKGYAAGLIADVTKQNNKLTKLCKILERLCSEEADDATLPELINNLQKAQTAHTEIQVWAERFGLLAVKPKRKKKGNH